MPKFDHIITVLKKRFYTISVKRATIAITGGFASATLADLLVTHSVNNAVTVGATAAGYVLLGYLQPAAKGQSFRDQINRLAKEDENAQNTDNVPGGTCVPHSLPGPDAEGVSTGTVDQAGDNK